MIVALPGLFSYLFSHRFESLFIMVINLIFMFSCISVLRVANNKSVDQTVRMRMLICTFVVHTYF